MEEDLFFQLVFVFWALSSLCVIVAVPSLRKVLRSDPNSLPVLSDRRLHILYVLLGLQGAVMLAQMILGFVAGFSIKTVLLYIFVVDPGRFGLYTVQILSFYSIHQTRKAKKQTQENSGDPPSL